MQQNEDAAPQGLRRPHRFHHLISPRRWLQRLVFWGGAVAVAAVAILFAIGAEHVNALLHRALAWSPYLPLLITPLGIAGQVTLDAVFPYARDLLAYPDLIEEGLMPHKVKKILFFGTEDINLRIDITETFRLKLEALRCHKSQIIQLGISDLEKWLWERCQKMAEGENFEVAEAFHQVEVAY